MVVALAAATIESLSHHEQRRDLGLRAFDQQVGLDTHRPASRHSVAHRGIAHIPKREQRETAANRRLLVAGA